jgi:hypothetical protein
MGTSHANSGTPGTKGEIFTFGSDVEDITGFKLQLLLNYRGKSSSDKADHPPGDAPGDSGIGLIWVVSGLGNTPLNELFDKLWSGDKDKSGKTMHDRALETALEEIKKEGGTNVTGTIPRTGKLRALVSDGLLLLSYWLPAATFSFNKGPLGASWSLTFNIELFISINLVTWPKPLVAGQVNVSDADISPANVGASLDDFFKKIVNFVTEQPLALFQTQEGDIDSTSPRPPDLGPLTKLLNDVGKAGVPLGFLKASAAVASKGSTLDLRMIHAVDPGPKLVDSGKDLPHLLAPTIGANLVQVAAGGDVTVKGIDFPPAKADAFYIGWDDTVTGDITQSEIRWSANGKPEQHDTVSRKPFDGKNSYTATGLQSETTFQVQVRDADELTLTDWSNPVTIKTGKSDAVDVSLKNGSSAALGTAKRDTSGSFTAKVKVPIGTTAGKHTITASSDSFSSSTTIEVLGSGQSAKPLLVAVSSEGVIRDPLSVMSGAILTLLGEGFQAGTVALTILGGGALDQGTTGADGTFTAKAHLPQRTGAITLVASQTVGSTSIQATLAVSVHAPPS